MSRSQRSGSASGDSQTCLIEENGQTSITIPVNPALYCQLFSMVSLLGGIFIVPALYRNEEPLSTDTFSIVNYLHLLVWIIITVLTWYVKAEHKRSRVLGYHEFYDSTRHFHRVAFYVLSGGNVLLLVICCITHNFCMGGGVSPCSLELSLTPVNYLQIIIVLEITIVLPFLIKHIVEVTRFNQACSPPDVYTAQTDYQQGQNSSLVANRDQSYVERLLEHQADQIMTLNKRKEVLQKELYILSRYRLDQEENP